MAGLCAGLLPTVHVVQLFQCNRLCPAPRVVSLIRNVTAFLLNEVCHQVHVEPELQVVSNPDSFSLSTANTQKDAWLDIAMNDFGVDGPNVVLWMSVSSILMLL